MERQEEARNAEEMEPEEGKEEEKTAMKSESEIEEETREVLLRQLKREVKQIMEESVTRRFIHEESNYVTSICATVESCLVHQLKRRVLGLFGTTSTFALLHKISKLCPAASTVLREVLQNQQQQLKDKRVSSTSLDRFRSTTTSVRDLPVSARYLWIRRALFDKSLATIVDFIANNASRYYEKEALMMDSVRANMVASLIVGPCALEYTKMKTMDNYWADPPADELVQRHRIHSGRSLGAGSVGESPVSPRRPPLQTQRIGSIGAGFDDFGFNKSPSTGRDYVFSLHQNFRSTLLYGKNNVSLCPTGHDKPMKGYLSLHQNSNGTLSIKWTPNELMHSSSADTPNTSPNRSALWQTALNLNVNEIIYLHFHQQGDTGGSIVFVGADGIQHPPVQFPIGQHPLSFLSCLENGLLPWGQLDPPLWLHKGKGKVLPKLRRRTSFPNGRFIPNELSSSSVISESVDHCTEINDKGHDEMSQDYVFRIIPVVQSSKFIETCVQRKTSASNVSASSSSNSRLVTISSFSSLLKERFMSLSSSPASSPPSTPKTASTTSEDISSYPIVTSAPTSMENSKTDKVHESALQRLSDPLPLTLPDANENDKVGIELKTDYERATNELGNKTKGGLQAACDSMRNQIVSRAFYGWLAHCRHLKTIRTHLSCLVRSNNLSSEGPHTGITPEVWQRLRTERSVQSENELHRLVYYGGVSHELRHIVWPYLLHCIQWNEDIDTKMRDIRLLYEGSMTEWMAVEAIVRQYDKEAFYAARDREWKESHTDVPLVGQDSTLSVDVFETNDQTAANENGPKFPEQENPDNIGGKPPEAIPKHIDSLKIDAWSVRSTPELGDGGTYSKELIDTFALNLHRIEKDVHRCDRNNPYFTDENLEKLKNVMCTYVWEHLDSGYVQGMCDLAAPLLVIFDDEILSHCCFTRLMDRMGINFPHGGGMDIHLANMRSLIQVMDPELFDLMQRNGDYTHFYFCYRWFLLDFKRELAYTDVFRVWETIWSASYISSNHFVLFLGLALLLIYREIILDNNMDFTDIIKFFNEMAERHDASALLNVARDQIRRLQNLVDSV